MPEDNGSTALLGFAPRAVQEAIPPAEADEDLLRRIAGGANEALGAFYDRYSGLVWGLLRRMLGESGEAEEVLQEAFLQVWRDAKRYDSQRATPRGWLLLIARSRALDRLRKRAALQRREDALTREEAGRAVAPLGSRRLEHVERRQRINSALERLPREQRRVIELAFFHGLSQTEIAAHLGAPLGTIKSRALLGMKRLRQIFAAEGDGLPQAVMVSRA